MTTETCRYPTCIIDSGASKVFYFFRPGASIIPHKHYYAVLDSVYKPGDVLVGGIGAHLLGATFVGLHDIDIVSDDVGCYGNCIECREKECACEVGGAVVRRYSWDLVFFSKGEVEQVGKYLVANKESTVIWWLNRALSFAFGKFIDIPEEQVEYWRYRAPKALAELIAMYDMWKSELRMDLMRKYAPSCCKNGYYREKAESLPGSTLEKQACAYLYDHFGVSVTNCSATLRELVNTVLNL